MLDVTYPEACDELVDEFALDRAIVASRATARFVQAEVAERMYMTESEAAHEGQQERADHVRAGEACPSYWSLPQDQLRAIQFSVKAE